MINPDTFGKDEAAFAADVVQQKVRTMTRAALKQLRPLWPYTKDELIAAERLTTQEGGSLFEAMKQCSDAFPENLYVDEHAPVTVWSLLRPDAYSRSPLIRRWADHALDDPAKEAGLIFRIKHQEITESWIMHNYGPGRRCLPSPRLFIPASSAQCENLNIQILTEFINERIDK